jgi:hypothetical protein
MATPLLGTTGIETLAARLHALGDDAPRAVVRALNRSRTTVMSRMLRSLAAATGLTQARLRKSMRSQKATLSRPEATINLYGGRARLIDFGRAQQRAHLPKSGFRARMPGSGHVGYFERAAGSRHRRKGEPFYPHELPIREVYGPPFTAFLPDTTVAMLLALGGESLRVNLEHEIAFRAQRQAGTAA